MVTGIDRFRSHFSAFSDQYLLIGGAACQLLMDDAGIAFRATKDLDIVLSAEALTTEFVTAFWAFIDQGRYEHRHKGEDRQQFYRFEKPAVTGFPYMLELFSREPNTLTVADGSHLTPVPTDAGVVSLSAILLNDDYYTFISNGRLLLDGVPLIGAEYLLSLKAKAWCELTERKEAGDSISSKEIKKHRNDVFRLFVLIDPTFGTNVPTKIREDMGTFLAQIGNEEIDLKAFGINKQTLPDVIQELRRVYQVR